MNREALADPAWQLIDFDAGYWEARGEPPPKKPPATAELASPPAWASLYEGNRPVATWYRAIVPESGPAL